MTTEQTIKNCGSCAHWDAKNKRNCSTPESPHYMADCLFDVDSLLPPHCVVIEQTYELNGCKCPRHFARTQTFLIRLTPKEDNP